MINKKGLSDIIATVLIILLALAAVVIVWQFVRPTIESTAGQTSLQAKCFQVEAVPTRCDSSGETITIQLRKGSLTDISKIIAIAELPAGGRSQGEITGADIPTLFASKEIPDIPSAVEATARASVVVKDGTKEFACEPSTVTVTCADYT